MPDINFQTFGNKNFQMDKVKKDSKAVGFGNSTDRGTTVMKPGEDMNKNMFLQILAAELSNQDPTKAQDNTQYVTQMAQFASLEQMSNLNTTMRLSGAQGLTGKFVALNASNAMGYQEVGIVQSVYKSSGNVYITVLTPEGEVKSFNYDDVLEVMDMDDPTLDYINFINAANLIGKDVEIWDEAVDGGNTDGGDGDIDEGQDPGFTLPPDGGDPGFSVDPEEVNKKRPYGTVTEVFRDEEGIKVRVHLKDENGKFKYDESGNPVIEEYPFDYIMNIKQS